MLEDIVGEIIKHLPHNLLTTSLVSKLWYVKSKIYIKNLLKELLPPKIINAFNGIDYIISLPILKLNVDSDYVNKKMMTFPIMLGIDPYKRPYFFIKYTANNNINVITLYQRYKGDIDDWRGCGHHNPDHFFDTSYGLLNWEQLNQLVSGKEVNDIKCDIPYILKLKNND